MTTGANWEEPKIIVARMKAAGIRKKDILLYLLQKAESAERSRTDRNNRVDIKYSRKCRRAMRNL